MKNTNKQNTKKSKFLSLILRHQPSVAGLELDEEGWVSIDKLLTGCASKGVNISRPELESIVSTNDKQRFTICQKTNRIRANQGHSIPIELNLTPTTPPDILYHGTATRFQDAIFDRGLLKMNRHHVHLSADKQMAKKVGQRHGKLLLLEINTGQMTEDGFEFYLSANNVWLVDRVPTCYLTIVN